MKKRVISLMLALAIMVSVLSTFAISASAAVSLVNAFDVPTESKYAMVYTISKSGKTTPYTSSNLTTRGTITYGASSSAYIDNASDQLYLLDAGVTNGKSWAKISYPVGNSRAKAYIPLSAISSASYSKLHLYCASSNGKFYCATRKGSSTSSSYYVSKGEPVYVLNVSSTSGTNVQIMYPASGKWRIGYCSYSDCQKYLGSSSGTTSTSNTSNTTSTSNTSNNNSKISFNYSSSGSYTYSTASSVNLKINGTSITNGSTFYTYNKSGSSKTTSGDYKTYPYVKIGNNYVNVGSAQCQAYVRYCQHLLYGASWYEANSKFPNLIDATSLTASTAKTYITQAGAGAHIRTQSGHSIFVISVDSNGFYFTDANSDGKNGIRVGHFTWAGFAGHKYSKVKYIEIYKG